MKPTEVKRGMYSQGGETFEEPPPEKRTKKATTVHEAIIGEIDMDEVAELVRGGADIEEKDGDGQTPLMVGTLTNTEDLVKKLLELGADPLAQDPRGSTAAHMAASMGHGNLINLLVEAPKGGAKVITATNLMGSTPLHFAAKLGHPKAVQTLLDLGADSRVRDRSGATAEQDAANQAKQLPGRDRGQKDAIKLLRAAPTPEEWRQLQAEKAQASRTRKKKKRKKKAKGGGDGEEKKDEL